MSRNWKRQRFLLWTDRRRWGADKAAMTQTCRTRLTQSASSNHWWKKCCLEIQILPENHRREAVSLLQHGADLPKCEEIKLIVSNWRGSYIPALTPSFIHSFRDICSNHEKMWTYRLKTHHLPSVPKLISMSCLLHWPGGEQRGETRLSGLSNRWRWDYFLTNNYCCHLHIVYM